MSTEIGHDVDEERLLLAAAINSVGIPGGSTRYKREVRPVGSYGELWSIKTLLLILGAGAAIGTIVHLVDMFNTIPGK